MLDEATARALAHASYAGEQLTIGDATELREGWYFRFRPLVKLVGAGGVIVNKRTGRLFPLGSVFPPERDCTLYDLGYPFELAEHIPDST